MEIITELLQNPAGAILSFFMVLFALKEIITLFKWFSDLIKKRGGPQQEFDNRLKKVESAISATKVSQQNSEEGAKKMNKILDLLLESDRDDIKGYIVEKYYEFHAKGSIDGYSLDCLERKYKIYSREGGNTYITNLMNEIRELPIVTPAEAVEMERNRN